ncbi:S-DNA-T family DNA segregation ATPase FtsK/SpoIIIE [Anseongella ginsenosidimutans]|uniref:S-DNA-T family DNA segregation ATPase FtsK/SpoIIIE n=1 Tax=Anseongella ginsenosidimutans TaxID=496056 RepID=A0A4R3KMD0_9SPHI|nr:DNA translocase FtsK [Anseongella ginsenosidimutans]QEC52707.1 DNA translocase FtsK [Anseongella ginsenosidimutans]TCS85455.1 S-DNA-T family DNA segregation ATPase FtsK/SpoIIIE [Anseongella ginsenosidimutans]
MSDTENRLRNEFKNRAKGSRKVKAPRKKRNKLFRLPEIKFRHTRFVKILGLFCLLISVFLLIALTSYLFTWKQDQSYVFDSPTFWKFFRDSEALPSELKERLLAEGGIQNWMGKLGAFFSHQLVYNSFGLASFVFIAFFFILGYRLLFAVSIFSVRRSLVYTLGVLLYIPLVIAFVNSFINNSIHYAEGVYGYQTNIWLNITLGKAGTGFLLLFAAFSAVVFIFNPSFSLFRRRRKTELTQPEAFNEEEEAENILLEEEIVFDPIELNPREREKGAETKTINDFFAEKFGRKNKARDGGESMDSSESIPPETTAGMHRGENMPPDRPENSRPADQVLRESGVLPESGNPAVQKTNDPAFSIEATEEEKLADSLVHEHGLYDPTLDLQDFRFPHLDLLETYGSSRPSVTAEELEANKNKIVGTLANYGIDIDKIKATIGPTVTLYEIVPSPGVRISKIRNLEDDIALSLAALGIRIIAPIPGRGTIGIEVPNQHPEIVSMRSVMATEKYQNANMELPIALGKNISNEVYIVDLAKMPHLLMAGATGQGKSVGINALLVSLLYKKHPAQLKFVMVDPKKVELTLYRKIERHYLAKLPGEGEAIITDTRLVINTLNSLCIEMDNRYELLKDAGVRNIKEYNKKFVSRKLNPNEGHRFLPYIVLVIDEFADLMMTAGKEIETPIARLAQLARAIGIHLVIATQRPSVNIITGTIKANFPARIAFRVTSKIDSRTILDAGGADQLIGRGDMLLSTGSDVIRLQCALVDTPEVEHITDYIGSQRAYPTAYELPEYVDESGDGNGAKAFDSENRDQMFDEAARLVVRHQQGSTSLIQRKLKLGYNRAGRIIDQLEAAGIVGPFEGSKARDVLIQDEYALEQLLNDLGN